MAVEKGSHPDDGLHAGWRYEQLEQFDEKFRKAVEKELHAREHAEPVAHGHGTTLRRRWSKTVIDLLK